MLDLTWQHPQNPYDSFMVQASAGSGKTYQLSKRFLNLVATGAQPGHILTITFTVKAANEMRSRIIGEASRLLVDANEQQIFDQQMSRFFHLATKRSKEQGARLSPPLKGVQVAQAVLAATQLLRVSTIDALFKDWVSRFPFEARPELGRSAPAQFSMLDPMDTEKLNEAAWLDLFRHQDSLQILGRAWDALKKLDPDKGPLSIRPRVTELLRLRTHLWQGEFASGSSGFAPLQGPSEPTHENLSQVLAQLSPSLKTLAMDCKAADAMLAAIAARDFKAMVSLRLLTKEARIHKGTFRAKKQERYAQEIMEIESALEHYFNWQKTRALNELGEAFYQVYQAWVSAREARKERQLCLEFHDLAMACYRLFHGEHGIGVTWLLQQSIQHLLLDEFQDTSLLQWSVFEKLASELLSGAGIHAEQGSLSSVFIVGDKKQSIYGFREADPEVMHLAQVHLAAFEKRPLALNASFRSSSVVLDFVNAVFSPLDRAFPRHCGAIIAGKTLIPDVGAVRIHAAFEGDDEQSGMEKEAAFVACHLGRALDGSVPYPVWDKATLRFRRLRPQDVCLLYRNASHVAVFEKALRRYGVPYRLEEKKGFFGRSEVDDLLAFMHYLSFSNDTNALAQLLKSPIYALNDAQLWQILEDGRMLQEEKDLDYMEGFMSSLQLKFPAIADSLAHWSQEADAALPHELLFQAYRDLDVLQRYQRAYGGEEGRLAQKNLLKLLELAMELEEGGALSIPQCLEGLRDLSAKGELSPARMSSDVVTLMTIHKSKGLEYPLVVLVEAAQSWHKADPYWLKRKGTKSGVSFVGTRSMQPESLASFKALLAGQVAEMEAEDERLLYVALTRASQFLLVTGHMAAPNYETNFLGRLLEAIKECPGFSEPEPNLWLWQRLPAEHDRRQSDNLSRQETKVEGLVKESGAIRPPAKNSRVPWEVDIIQAHGGSEIRAGNAGKSSLASLPPVIATAVGTFIHEGLEYAANAKAWDSSEAWLRLVQGQGLAKRQAWQSSRWQELQAACLAELQQTYTHPKWLEWLNQAKLVEAEMSIVQLEGDKLMRGQIDLLLEFDREVLVVDYKTANLPLTADPLQHSTKNDSLVKPWTGFYPGHRLVLEDLNELSAQKAYARQLWIYVKAVRQLFPSKPIKGLVWFTKTAQWLELIRSTDCA